MPHGNPGDFLFVNFGHHLHRRRRTYPKQHIGWSNNLTNLAVATQHHSVQRRAKHECIEPYFLGADTRFGFLELSRPLLVFGLRGFAFVAIALGAIEITLELFIVDFQFVERAALFRVVLAGKDLANFDRLPLAAAEFD